jgi:hypothetical protein
MSRQLAISGLSKDDPVFDAEIRYRKRPNFDHFSTLDQFSSKFSEAYVHFLGVKNMGGLSNFLSIT